MEKFIEQNLDEIIDDLRQLVSYNSIFNDDEKPFGSENRKILDKTLSLMEKKGLKTNNLDYYCGYGEVGQGDKVIGIISHLDIVPAGEGWIGNPFELRIDNNTLYGRGVSDDKGAGVAAMWAIKYLIDTNYQFKKRIRLIVGCNEENGSACIKHYVERCGDVDMGFTPDANFPGVFAEKGMIGGYLIGHNTKIIDIKAGDATNIVPRKCITVIPHNSIDINKLNEYFSKNNIKYEFNDNKLIVYGKAAHASTPDEGINSISYTMAGLQYAGINDSFVDFYMKNIGLTCHGELMGYDDLKDDLTNTSINIGMASKEDNDIKLTVDMRFPVKSNSKTCLEPLLKIKEKDNEFISSGRFVEPLFFDVNSPFIKALDKAYRTITNDNVLKMEAIGGGTYAKAIKNVIAFGCEYNGENNHIHDANECLKIDSLKKQILIYIEAIKNLNEVE